MAGPARSLRPDRRTAAYLFLCAVVAFSFWVDHQQDVGACQDQNRSRRETVGILVEALIGASEDAEPGRVEAFVDDIDARLRRAEVNCT